ncbi:hypothetical protein MHK_006434 [Candidatus Magnetomorum sp. HK-1]|nr:hypothetical protein MHK_006434 [Candidatus Magnetomorum sp. HK-1]
MSVPTNFGEIFHLVFSKPHAENKNKTYSSYSSVLSTTTFGDSPTLDHYVKEGREYMKDSSFEGAIKAKNSFEKALSIQPDHGEPLLFHAITRFAPLLDVDTNYTPGLPIENLNELMDLYGVDKQGRDITDWLADYKRDDEMNVTVPDTSPLFSEIQNYIQSVWISEIDAALNDLSSINDDFNLFIKKEEISDDCEEDIEIDYGEVLLIKSALQLFKTACYMVISYDMDVNLKEVLDKMYADIINVNIDLLNKYHSLFMLIANGDHIGVDARTAFINAIDLYFESSAFIRSESDDQKSYKR